MEIKTYLRQIFGRGGYTEDYLPVIARNQKLILAQKIYSSV
tara:strand:+ start:1020 stop:1142 length:123 start_codon:yes stop_codon:yes gene_type:complete